MLLVEDKQITVIIPHDDPLTKDFYKYNNLEIRTYLGMPRKEYHNFHAVSFPKGELTSEQLQSAFQPIEYSLKQAVLLKSFLYTAGILVLNILCFVIAMFYSMYSFIPCLLIMYLAYKLNTLYTGYLYKVRSVEKVKTYVLYTYAGAITTELNAMCDRVILLQSSIADVNKAADDVLATAQQTTRRYNDLCRRVSPKVLKAHKEYCDVKFKSLILSEADNPSIIH